MFTNGSAVSSGSLTSHWTLGDANSSSVVNPTKSFVAAGSYQVGLVTTSNFGCLDSLTKTVTVHPQPTAAFTVNDLTQCLKGNHFDFTNSSSVSTGSFSSQWSFGDNMVSNVTAPSHVYTTDGSFSARLIAITNNGCRDTAVQMITVDPSPMLGADKTITIGCVDGNADISQLYATEGYSSAVFSVSDPTMVPAGVYSLIVSNGAGCTDTAMITVNAPPKNTLPAAGAGSRIANRECTDSAGWTHYYFDNGTPANFSDDKLLLSLQKNGNNIGTTGTGSFQVKTATTTAAGTNMGTAVSNPLIDNASGFWAFNRYWQVTPSAQPATNVGVRFYYTLQDLNDVNGANPGHTHQQLIFYTLSGGNPDPETNFAGAQGINSYVNGTQADTATWTWHQLNGNTYYAEFLVKQFNGGGGGVTGDNKVLPLTITSFTAVANGENVRLRWTTAQEVDGKQFNIQRSTSGRTFTTIGRVNCRRPKPGVQLHRPRRVQYRCYQCLLSFADRQYQRRRCVFTSGVGRFAACGFFHHLSKSCHRLLLYTGHQHAAGAGN